MIWERLKSIKASIETPLLTFLQKYPFLKTKKTIVLLVLVLLFPIIIGIVYVRTNLLQHAASLSFANYSIPGASFVLNRADYNLSQVGQSKWKAQTSINLTFTLPKSLVIDKQSITPKPKLGVDCMIVNANNPDDFQLLSDLDVQNAQNQLTFIPIYSSSYVNNYQSTFLLYLERYFSYNPNNLTHYLFRCIVSLTDYNDKPGYTHTEQTTIFPEVFDFSHSFSSGSETPLTSPTPGQTGNPGSGSSNSASCPNPLTDAKTYSQKDADGKVRCDSSTGLGFNTAGGTYTCGPVACPGDNSGKYPHGNTCVYIAPKGDPNGNAGKCIAGYGDSGFNPPHCQYNPADNGQALTQCPSPIDFFVDVSAPTQHIAASQPVLIVINDNGRKQTISVLPNSANKVSFKTYSGDSIDITPQTNTRYTAFSPSVIHAVANTWSCGGTSNPCSFSAKEAPAISGEVSPTQAPTPTSSPTQSACQQTCPNLPAGCTYTSSNTCCQPTLTNSCQCPQFVCKTDQ